MKIYTVFDDNFLEMAKAFFHSKNYFSSVPAIAHLPHLAAKSIRWCQENNIEYFVATHHNRSPKQVSRILKMECCGDLKEEEPVAYMDIDIIFQNDIGMLEDLNPNYLWVLSKREGRQTSLRKWKRHYFRNKTAEFARKHLPELTDLSVDELFESPVRNCGVIYGNRNLVRKLLQTAKQYYLKMLDLNKKDSIFSDSDQLCFMLAFASFQGRIKELPLKFNRMPYHQSYDYKDYSGLVVPDSVVLHLNKCKKLGDHLVKSWSRNSVPKHKVDSNTRLGIVVPMQTSSIAERSLTKNLYSLAVSNKANIYRDEDIGFPIQKKIIILDEIRDSMVGERPAYDRGLFFMVNGRLFMIDHGEHVKHRAAWIIGKYTSPDLLSGIFIEQMNKNLDTSKSKIPIIPLSYGTKDPLLWLNQGTYRNISLCQEKKYSVHFIGKIEKNRSKCVGRLSKIAASKIEHRINAKRISFDEYMQDLARAKIAWCPFGNRPKTHREIEAMCCEVAVMMPDQNVVEQEELIPDVHYISINQDHSDALDKVQYYLDDPNKLQAIAHQGHLWYQRNTSNYARAKYIYDQCVKILR